MVELKLKLPDSFFLGEERDGYLVTPEMKKVWAVELDLLAEFMRVCQNYNIQWWADAGTILGAARHKGFIPWDDDIDVMMMRDEYNRFIELCSGDFKQPYYLQHGDETCHFHLQLRNSLTTGILKNGSLNKYQFNQGIFIDIFPIDDKVDDPLLFAQQCREIKALKKKALIYKTAIMGRPLFHLRKNVYLYLKTIAYSIYLKISHTTPNIKVIIHEIDKVASKYDNGDTKEVCKMVLKVKPRRFWKRDWFSDTVYLPFEMFKLPVPIGYEKLLDRFYNNWHEYVIGTATHGSVFFDTDKPYTEYIRR